MKINDVISELRDMDGDAELYVMLPNNGGIFHFTSVEMTDVLETDEGKTIYCIIPFEPEQKPFIVNYN
jgi:hypothetical protein